MKLYEQMQTRKVYPNQEGIERRIKENLLSTKLNHPCVDEVRLMGSLAFGRFGVYHEPEHPETRPKYASDVDLLITLNENYSIPEEWGESKEFIFFDVYNLGTILGLDGIEDNVHEVEVWAYDPSQANEKPRLTEEMTERMKQSNDERLKFRTRREWLDWQIKNHDTKLWFRK